MYKIRIIWVGKTQDAYLQTGIDLYLKKIKNYLKIECLEIKPFHYSSGSVEQGKIKETAKILEKIDAQEMIVFLDERGESCTSIELAQWLEEQKRIQFSCVNFVVGGAYGWDRNQIPQNSRILSFSSMTLNHQMIRILLLEQIYRAFTIMNGEPYHH
jgi:23S rRNA (pseudouridine1915-N3)-methyltransferase